MCLSGKDSGDASRLAIEICCFLANEIHPTAYMRYLPIVFLLFLTKTFTYASDGTSALLNELNATIASSAKYDSAKVTEIAGLKKQLDTVSSNEVRFAINLQLYNDYRIFKYDSAFAYAKKLQFLAADLHDQEKITSAKLKMAFILLSSGMFKETLDTLSTVNIQLKSTAAKAEYYTLMGRYYYDLAGYIADPHYSPDYDVKGNRYIDSALQYYPHETFEYNYYTGLRNYKSGNIATATTSFERLLATNLPFHQYAVTASTLSGIYFENSQPDKAIDLLIKAAIADIKSSTKETVAVFNLAQLLYKKGDVKMASLFIESAVTNADFYGARQRKVQMSTIVSLIDAEKINNVETQRRILLQYAGIVTLFVILLATSVVIILKQMKKLKQAQKVITEAHRMQQEINAKLEDANKKLEEANKIKEEYIGYFFNMDSDFFSKLERLKKSLEQKIAEKKHDEVKYIVGNINPKKEREDLLKDFDKVFLKLFPNFVNVYNSMFKEEDKIILRDNELLNTDLRIFALIRMGIHDNEKIAQILQYSVNTIYAYKTKIRNKSLVPNDEFEAKIMSINTV